uniref:Putative insect conserved secreted peptide n=1 Tax=Panstrongylus lignarius TaxID=156445 RepID=A0A224XUE6_9HEMI
MAICLPCFVIPFFLFIWRFIQPWILMFWNSEKKLPEAQQHKVIASTSTNTSSCPVKNTSTEADVEDKKEQ